MFTDLDLPLGYVFRLDFGSRHAQTEKKSWIGRGIESNVRFGGRCLFGRLSDRLSPVLGVCLLTEGAARFLSVLYPSPPGPTNGRVPKQGTVFGAGAASFLASGSGRLQGLRE